MSNHADAIISGLGRQSCARCQRPIEVTSPTWCRLTWDITDDRGGLYYEPDERALCTQCQLEVVEESQREGWRELLAQLANRKEYSGIPFGVTMFHQRTVNSHVAVSVDGVFQFDLFFVLYCGQVSNDWVLPILPVQLNEGDMTMTLLFTGLDIYLEGVPAIARFSWDISMPTAEGALRIDRWRRTPHSQFMRLMEGVSALMSQMPTGRPRGTGRYANAQEFHAAYRRVLAEMHRENVRPTSRLIADRLFLSKSAYAVYKRKWGTGEESPT